MHKRQAPNFQQEPEQQLMNRRTLLGVGGFSAVLALTALFSGQLTTSVQRHLQEKKEANGKKLLEEVLKYLSNFADKVTVGSFDILETPMAEVTMYSDPEKPIQMPKTPYICTLQIECSTDSCTAILDPTMIRHPRAISLEIMVDNNSIAKNTTSQENLSIENSLQFHVPNFSINHVYRKASITVQASDAAQLITKINNANFNFPQTFSVYIQNNDQLTSEEYVELENALIELSNLFTRKSDLTIMLDHDARVTKLKDLLGNQVHIAPAQRPIELASQPPPPVLDQE